MTSIDFRQNLPKIIHSSLSHILFFFYFLMNIVASHSIAAHPFFEKTETNFCFVACVGSRVASKFLRSVSKLALFSVRAIPMCDVVTAK